MKKVWIVLLLLVAAAAVAVGIWNAQHGNSNEQTVEEAVDSAAELGEMERIPMESEEISPEAEVPTQETPDAPSEEELQQEWEDLTQQFADMGGVELPEDVF